MPPKVQWLGSSAIAEVDATPAALRVAQYASNGNQLGYPDLTQISFLNAGMLFSGRDNKTTKELKSTASSILRSNDESPFFYDNCEGTTINTTKWMATATTMSAGQAAATGINLNSLSTTTATTGIQYVTHRAFPQLPGGDLIGRFYVRNTTHFQGNVFEVGFGDPTTATSSNIVNGAFLRKGMGGDWYPVVVTASLETIGPQIATAAQWSAAIPATEYYAVIVELRRNLARFKVYNKTNTLLFSQDVPYISVAANAGTPGFSATQVRAFVKTYNVTAVTTAVQHFLKDASVTQIHAAQQRAWPICLAGMGDTSLMNPVQSTQTANYTNNTTATTRTLSNTAAGESTLGGTLVANAMATGAPTDLIMFGWPNPSNSRTFFVESIQIPVPLNQVATITTTDTIFQYFVAWNSSAVSLATTGAYPPNFLTLNGIHRGVVTSPASTLFTGDTIRAQFDTPIPVFPGRFFHIGCRCLLGTATATETFLWAGVLVTGFYE